MRTRGDGLDLEKSLAQSGKRLGESYQAGPARGHDLQGAHGAHGPVYQSRMTPRTGSGFASIKRQASAAREAGKWWVISGKVSR